MTAVVDSSVLVAALVDTGPEGVWAESVVDGGQLTCPELALAEASNILRRLELTGDLSRLEATVAHESLMRLDLGLFPFAPFAGRIWELRMNLTCYDAWYVALAEALDSSSGNPRREARPGQRSQVRDHHSARMIAVDNVHANVHCEMVQYLL